MRVFVHVCVCVSSHQAIKNHSCEIKAEYQVLLFFSFFIRHWLLILLMDVALVMKHIVNSCQRRARLFISQ